MQLALPLLFRWSMAHSVSDTGGEIYTEDDR